MLELVKKKRNSSLFASETNDVSVIKLKAEIEKWKQKKEKFKVIWLIFIAMTGKPVKSGI